MLVLTRKNDESIWIGNKIKVTVIQAEDGKVRLGIDAPASVKVHREEVFELIKAENRKAMGIGLDLAELSKLNSK